MWLGENQLYSIFVFCTFFSTLDLFAVQNAINCQIVLMTESCTIDITFEVIHFVLHFQASCSECLQMRIHEGPHHIISPISHLAASSSVEEEKIKSSSARELTLIEAT